MLAVISTLACLSWVVVRIVKATDFDFGCKSYLKRAADANTIEVAKPELDKAIEYLEEHDLTSGIVSIFLKNPANDVGYFYQNLKASQAELAKADSNMSQLEESNVLMKLRETLLDDGESTSVTCPAGISIYPNNVGYFWWSIISFILAIVFWIWQYVTDNY